MQNTVMKAMNANSSFHVFSHCSDMQYWRNGKNDLIDTYLLKESKLFSGKHGKKGTIYGLREGVSHWGKTKQRWVYNENSGLR